MIREVKFHNFGKLRDTAVQLGRFTVFAGKNGTGKSFAAKAIYSLINAAGTMDITVYIQQRIAFIRSSLEAVGGENFMDDSRFPEMESALQEMDLILDSVHSIAQSGRVSAFEEKFADISAAARKIDEIYQAIDGKIASYILKHEELGTEESAHLDMGELVRLRQIVGMLKSMGDNKDETKNMFLGAFDNALLRSILHNFQARKIFDLYNQRDDYMEIGVEGDGEHWTIRYPAESMRGGSNQRFSSGSDGDKTSHRKFCEEYGDRREIYLESPVLAQLKTAIESIEEGRRVVMPRTFRARSALTGVPRYYYDMLEEMKKKYTDESISDKLTFSDVSNRLTGEGVLNGKVSIADMTGEMILTENDGGSYPLARSASGAANIGVLAMLIENNVFDKGDFLFADEPEAHLHPEWQVEMAEALFALAKGGVNVVIATHSADILKWLEVHLKENPELGDIVEINHFGKEGVKSNGGDVHEKLDAIQEELAHPYYKLYYRGV